MFYVLYITFLMLCWTMKYQKHDRMSKSGRGQVCRGQVRTCQARTGKVRAFQDISGWCRAGPVRVGLVKPGQVKSGYIIQVKADPAKSGLVILGQVMISDLTSWLIKSSQDTYGHYSWSGKDRMDYIDQSKFNWLNFHFKFSSHGIFTQYFFYQIYCWSRYFSLAAKDDQNYMTA